MFSLIQKREAGFASPIQLYDAAKANKYFVQRLRLERRLEVHRGCVNTICWNDTGTSILSGSDDQHLAIADPFTGKVRASIRSGHHSNIFCAKFLPSSQDQEVVSCSGAGSVYYTQVDREDMYGQCLFNCHTGTTYELAVVPNEARTFLTCGEDSTVRWFDLRIKTSCNKERCKEDILINCRNPVTSLAVDPVLPYQLATACADGTVRVFDRRMLGTRLSGNYVGRLLTGLVSCFNAPLENKAHRITSLNYGPFSHDILVSYSAENIYLFNTQMESSKEFSKFGIEKEEPRTAVNGEEAASSSSSDATAQPPTKRLRLRGDWSDTGPHARPERERGEDNDGPPQVNLMQRMSDMLTRWLDGSLRRRGDNVERGGDNLERGASPRPELVNPLPEEEEAGEGADIMEAANLRIQEGEAEVARRVGGEEVGDPGEDAEAFRLFDEENVVRDDALSQGLSTVDENVKQEQDYVARKEGDEICRQNDKGSSEEMSVCYEIDIDSVQKDTKLCTIGEAVEKRERSNHTLVGEVSSHSRTVDHDCELKKYLSCDHQWISKPADVQQVQSMFCESSEATSSKEKQEVTVIEGGSTTSFCLNSQESLGIAGQDTDCGARDEGEDALTWTPRSHLVPENVDSNAGLLTDVKSMVLSSVSSASPVIQNPQGSQECEAIATATARSDPVISLHYSLQGTTASTVHIGYDMTFDPQPSTSGPRSPVTPGSAPSALVFNPATPLAASESTADCLESAVCKPSASLDRDEENMPPSPMLIQEILEDSHTGSTLTPHTLSSAAPTDDAPGPSHHADSSVTSAAANNGNRAANGNSEGEPGSSSGRHRRFGHSGPPTGDFQLVVNEDLDRDETDDDDDDTEAGRSHPVPFWSYGTSSNDERHNAALCMQSVFRRRMEERDKQALASVFQPQPLRMYLGHRNSRTMIKEANFWGDSIVMSGSDCGRIFLWDKETTQLIMLLEADRHVVNCLQPHPFDPVLATSGIDYDIKLWTPVEPEPCFDVEVAEEVMRRNQIMLEETRDTITVPAAFMLRVLASLNQIRAGRADRAAREGGPGGVERGEEGAGGGDEGGVEERENRDDGGTPPGID